jgi:hypothetical protein
MWGAGYTATVHAAASGRRIADQRWAASALGVGNSIRGGSEAPPHTALPKLSLIHTRLLSLSPSVSCILSLSI